MAGENPDRRPLYSGRFPKIDSAAQVCSRECRAYIGSLPDLAACTAASAEAKGFFPSVETRQVKERLEAARELIEKHKREI